MTILTSILIAIVVIDAIAVNLLIKTVGAKVSKPQLIIYSVLSPLFIAYMLYAVIIHLKEE